MFNHDVSSVDRSRLRSLQIEAEMIVGNYVLDAIGFDDLSLSELRSFVASVEKGYSVALLTGSSISEALRFNNDM